MPAASIWSRSNDCSDVMKIRQDHREQREVGQPIDRLGAEEDPDLRQHAIDRVHHHVFPQQRVGRGHDEERRDQQHAHEAAAGEGFVDQQCQRDAKDHRDGDHRAEQQQRVDHRRREIRVGDEELKVCEADEVLVAGLHQVVAHGREVQRHQQRHDHPEEERDHRWRKHHARQRAVHRVAPLPPVVRRRGFRPNYLPNYL
jgi:hypothetical protein